jgi:hypothetical protein
MRCRAGALHTDGLGLLRPFGLRTHRTRGGENRPGPAWDVTMLDELDLALSDPE